MRLLTTLHNDHDAIVFSNFLNEKGIGNQVEITTNRDWGSSDYGRIDCHIWIVEEDDVDTAREWLEIYNKNPNDPQFTENKTETAYLTPTVEPKEEQKNMKFIRIKPPRPTVKPIGVITFYLILGCTLLFFMTLSTMRPITEPVPKNYPLLPLFSSPVSKALYFDYPKKFEILDQIIDTYGMENLISPQMLPPEGQKLFVEYHQTSYWDGAYDKIVQALRPNEPPVTFHEPLFEKIKKGEFWRLVTPCILHNDFFHLFFNMIWLLVLGKQMELRLRGFRFILFMLITGTVSNISQYLMSGYDFIGFSGILVGMITFVWFRQKQAPWEGYQLLPMTMRFISIFILGLAGIQFISFLMEVLGKAPFGPPIANTAHLVGGLMGILLAKTKLFSWSPKK